MLILKVLRYVIFEWALSSNVVSCFTALIVIIPDIPATIRWIFILLPNSNILTQIHSHSSLPFADELFECVWPFCGVAA